MKWDDSARTLYVNVFELMGKIERQFVCQITIKLNKECPLVNGLIMNMVEEKVAYVHMNTNR